MKTRSFRHWILIAHRYVGLMLGLMLIIIGVTGSLLVFHDEIEAWLDHRQFQVIPMGQPISAARALEVAQMTYPQWTFDSLTFPEQTNQPLKLFAIAPDANPQLYQHGFHEVFINPYTGKVMDDRVVRFTFYRFLLNLHYRLFLPGDWLGRIITGIAALWLFGLAITGIALWPGWRKLSAGFRVKWKAHIKRFNFDLHKVIGILTAIFLAFTGFTGAYLSFYDWVTPVVDALALPPVTEAEESTPVVSSPVTPFPAALDTLLQTAQQAIPTLQVSEIYFPEGEPFEVYGRNNESVLLDPGTAKILKVEVSHQEAETATLSDRILRTVIAPLHFGTFWGLPSRILYVLVGLSPLVLFITGFIMWWHRKKVSKSTDELKLPS